MMIRFVEETSFVAKVACLLVALTGCSSSESSGGTGGAAGAAGVAGSVTTGGAGGVGGTGGGGAGGGVGGTGGGATGGAGGGCAGGSGTSGQVCAGPGYQGTAPKQTIVSLKATVVDQDGAPAANMLAQVCGTDLCVNAKTNAAGVVDVAVNQEMTKPAFKYGDGLDFGKLGYLLPAQPTHDLGTVTTIRLPAMACNVFEAGKEVESGGAKLSVPAGGFFEVDVLTYMSAEDQGFRAVEIADASSSPAIDQSLGLEMLWAFAPVDTHFCPKAKLSLPNSKGWTGGAQVEFYLHGVSIEEDWAPYAGWAKVSEGAVTADGQRVETSPDGGIAQLSVVGVRLKP